MFDNGIAAEGTPPSPALHISCTFTHTIDGVVGCTRKLGLLFAFCRHFFFYSFDRGRFGFTTFGGVVYYFFPIVQFTDTNNSKFHTREKPSLDVGSG